MNTTIKCPYCGGHWKKAVNVNELVNINDRLTCVINAYEGQEALFSCQGQAMDGYSALAAFVSIAKDARKLSKC